MPKGRKPKPTEIKRSLGNPGKRKLPDVAEMVVLEPAEAIPNPPRALGKSGSELWDRIWSIGMSWVSPTSDIDLLMMVCEMIDERSALRLQVLRDKRPEDRRALRTLDAQLMQGLSLLGFTPTDRSRLGIAEIKKRSKLEELRAKQQKG
jgi:hypothetical protein